MGEFDVGVDRTWAGSVDTVAADLSEDAAAELKTAALVDSSATLEDTVAGSVGGVVIGGGTMIVVLETEDATPASGVWAGLTAGSTLELEAESEPDVGPRATWGRGPRTRPHLSDPKMRPGHTSPRRPS